MGLYGVSEAAGVEEAAGDVVVEAAEAEGDAAAFAFVLLRVAADDLPVGAVREPQRRVGGVVEQSGGALLLFVGPQGLGLQQDAPALAQRAVLGAAPAGPLALEPASHGGELVAGEFDDAERVQYLFVFN